MMDDVTRSRKAFDYVMGRATATPRLRGDLDSKLRSIFAARLTFEPGGEHWLWSGAIGGSAKCNSLRPALSYWDHELGKRRQQHAFNWMLRTFFPDLWVPRNKRFKQTCDEIRCLSPFHRRDLTSEDFRSRSTFFVARDRESVTVLLKRWMAGERQADIARSVGIAPGTLSSIVHGDSWPDVFAEVTGREPREWRRAREAKRVEFAYTPRRRAARWISAEQRATVHSLWAERPITRLEIARRTGLNVRTVYRILKEGVDA